MIERFLFRAFKIEVWAILLILILFGIAVFSFGAIVHYRMDGGRGLGALGNTAVKIASVPQLAERVLSGRADRHRNVDRQFDQPGGFTYHLEVENPGYILLHRYDGNIKESIIELVREGETDPIHVWRFDDVAAFRHDGIRPAVQDQVTGDASTRRAKHAFVEESGELVFHFRSSPLYKYDVCQNLIWTNTDFAFHHALERDQDGNYWTPGNYLGELRFDDVDEKFHDDFLVKVSPEGEVLYAKSGMDILEQNGLRNRIYTPDTYVYDPLHLNDVEPMLQDGPHWNQGDVFLSIPHLNMIMQFRPETDEMIWLTQDVMLHQHDVDVLDEHRIAYFDNRRVTGAFGDYVKGPNEIQVYDFRDGSTTSPWREQLAEEDVRTVSQGLFSITEDGSVMAEDTNAGRIVMFNPAGELVWEYVNKDDNGNLYTANWTRYLEADYGDRVVESLAAADCG